MPYAASGLRKLELVPSWGSHAIHLKTNPLCKGIHVESAMGSGREGGERRGAKGGRIAKHNARCKPPSDPIMAAPKIEQATSDSMCLDHARCWPWQPIMTPMGQKLKQACECMCLERHS